MAVPTGAVLLRHFKDTKGLMWHYEDGLKGHILTLHKEAYPDDEKADDRIIGDELGRCYHQNTHYHLNEYLNKLEAGLTAVIDSEQSHKEKLGDKRQEYAILCKKIHEQKSVMGSHKATIASMKEEDNRKADCIASLQEKLRLMEVKNGQHGKELENAKKNAQALSKRVEGLEKKTKDKQTEMEELEQKVKAKHTEVEGLEEDFKAKEAEVEGLEEDLKVKEIETEALRIATGHLSDALKNGKVARWEELSEQIIKDLLNIEQEFSLSRSLARQTEELQDKVAARERTIVALAKELEELKEVQRRSQKQISFDLDGMKGMSPNDSQISGQVAGSSTSVIIKSVRIMDGEQEDIFVDCVTEQAQTVDVQDTHTGTGNGADSSHDQLDFLISGNSHATGTTSKSVWQDLSGIDLLGEEEEGGVGP